MAYSRESGAFSDLRERMEPFFRGRERASLSPVYDLERVEASRDLLSLGLTSEICIKRQWTEQQFNVRFYVGTTLGEYATFYESAPVHLNVAFAYQNEPSG
ncbi:MAG: hypothetical protein H7Y12_01400, partial [Sphingobacteriaceae bacterium]|nr:hypothetical protein [Cytophagaceae bacterium]